LSYAGGIHKKTRASNTRESLFYREFDPLSIRDSQQ